MQTSFIIGNFALADPVCKTFKGELYTFYKSGVPILLSKESDEETMIPAVVRSKVSSPSEAWEEGKLAFVCGILFTPKDGPLIIEANCIELYPTDSLRNHIECVLNRMCPRVCILGKAVDRSEVAEGGSFLFQSIMSPRSLRSPVTLFCSVADDKAKRKVMEAGPNDTYHILGHLTGVDGLTSLPILHVDRMSITTHRLRSDPPSYAPSITHSSPLPAAVTTHSNCGGEDFVPPPVAPTPSEIPQTSCATPGTGGYNCITINISSSCSVKLPEQSH